MRRWIFLEENRRNQRIIGAAGRPWCAMKRFLILLAASYLGACFASAGVRLDEQSFGDKLGGWTKRSNQAAEYPLSGSNYRTYRPEVSPTPDGGIFVSVRLDHMRGMLASDDHAVLESRSTTRGPSCPPSRTSPSRGERLPAT